MAMVGAFVVAGCGGSTRIVSTEKLEQGVPAKQ